jgi:hypothetical protein
MRVTGPVTGELLPSLVAPSLGAQRIRVFPEPRRQAAPAALRRWYTDVWWGMSEDDRRSVILVAGAGVAALFPLLENTPRLLGGIWDPLELLRSALPKTVALPTLGALLALEDPRDEPPKHSVWALANPQSRALLLGFPEADDLPVTLGPPADADRWRELLFEEALPQLRPVAREALDDSALALAREFGYPPRRLLAAVAGTNGDPRPIKSEHGELLRQLSWLDDELHRSLRGG